MDTITGTLIKNYNQETFSFTSKAGKEYFKFQIVENNENGKPVYNKCLYFKEEELDRLQILEKKNVQAEVLKVEVNTVEAIDGGPAKEYKTFFISSIKEVPKKTTAFDGIKDENTKEVANDTLPLVSIDDLNIDMPF